MTKPPLPKSKRLTLPEAVDLLIRAFGYNKTAARRRLKRALSDGSIYDIRPHIPYIDWEITNWGTGKVKAVDPNCGSPVKYITFTPTLKRRELEQHFKIGVIQTAPVTDAAPKLDTQEMHADWYKHAKTLKSQYRGYSRRVLAKLIAQDPIGQERSDGHIRKMIRKLERKWGTI